jgi:thiamine-monophosphate kinase
VQGDRLSPAQCRRLLCTDGKGKGTFSGAAMSQETKTIDHLGEFGFIRSIMKGCIQNSERVIRGIGDDCAVIGPYGNRVFLITTDLLMEHVHFLPGRKSFRDLGAKTVAVNLSDIAAMGGVPRHLFLSIAIPKGMLIEDLSQLYAGMNEMCGLHRVNLLGGDTSASSDGLFINITLIGEADPRAVLYRNGASPGDTVYVTGALGNAQAGLHLLTGKMRAPHEISEQLIVAHNRPQPRVETGRLIAESLLASAMIDISDGLTSDLGHLCEESAVGARLFEERLPLSEELKIFCRVNNLDPRAIALSGGEDYELLFTVPEKNAYSLERQVKSKGYQIFKLGEIVRERGLHLVSSEGRERQINPSGFNHFSRESP